MPETPAASSSRTQRHTLTALPNPSSASTMIGISVFRVTRRIWSCTSDRVETTMSGAARLDALPTDPDKTRRSYPTIWAMRAESGSKILPARVTAGFSSSARYISFFLDMRYPLLLRLQSQRAAVSRQNVHQLPDRRNLLE